MLELLPFLFLELFGSTIHSSRCQKLEQSLKLSPLPSVTIRDDVSSKTWQKKSMERWGKKIHDWRFWTLPLQLLPAFRNFIFFKCFNFNLPFAGFIVEMSEVTITTIIRSFSCSVHCWHVWHRVSKFDCYQYVFSSHVWNRVSKSEDTNMFSLSPNIYDLPTQHFLPCFLLPICTCRSSSSISQVCNFAQLDIVLGSLIPLETNGVQSWSAIIILSPSLRTVNI